MSEIWEDRDDTKDQASKYYGSVDQESSLFLTMGSHESSPVGPAA